MTPIDPDTPRYSNPDQRDEPTRPASYDRPAEQGDGMGTIVAIVVAAALVIAGLLYFMQPAPETPGKVTSGAPTVTTPAPPPARPSEPVK